MVRLPRLLPVGMALTLAACTDSPTGPDEVGSQSAVTASGATEVPTGGICRTTISFLPPVPGQAPNVAVIRVALDCNLQHLGRSSGEIIQTIVSSTTDLSNTLTGTMTYVAANGDELHASFTGTGLVDPAGPSVSFTGTETYIDGTGRFAGASGSSELSGLADLVTNTGEYRLTSGGLSIPRGGSSPSGYSMTGKWSGVAITEFGAPRLIEFRLRENNSGGITGSCEIGTLTEPYYFCTVSGTRINSTVDLTFDSPGFAPVILSGTFTSDSSVDMVITGSGWTSTPVTFHRK